MLPKNFLSRQFHIENGIRVALFIAIRSFVCFKAQMPIEPYRLRVLFVDGNAIDPIMMQDVLQQLFAKALAPLKRRRKEHFHAGVFKAHKGNDVDLRIFSND